MKLGGSSLTIVTLRRTRAALAEAALVVTKIFEPQRTQRARRKSSLITAGHRKGLKPASREDFRELVQQRVVHQAV